MLDIDKIVSDWFDLLSYALDKSKFDQSEFRLKHDIWAKRWARLDFNIQGEITSLITKKLVS